MQMHKDGQTVDIQPRSSAHWEAQGWKRGPAPKPAKKASTKKKASTTQPAKSGDTKDS